MKTIVLLLAILLAVSCQQNLVSDSYTGYWNKGPQADVQIYRGFTDHVDLAIHGWLKFDPNVKANTNQMNSMLTVQSLAGYNARAYPGESVFALKYTQNLIDLYIWSDGGNQQSRIAVPQNDYGKWVFFYMGYSYSQRKVYVHFELPSGVQAQTFTNIRHRIVNNYVVSSGSYSNVLFFPGTIHKLTITFGPSAYRENNFDQLKNNNPNPVQPVSKDCVIIYTQCYYLGQPQSLCEKRPMETEKIKSIYIPKGYSVKIENPRNSNEFKKYNSSVDCIYGLPWAAFEQQNVKFSKKEHLKRNKSQ